MRPVSRKPLRGRLNTIYSEFEACHIPIIVRVEAIGIS